MKLDTLLKLFLPDLALPEAELLLTHLSEDSRSVRPGTLFIAKPGAEQHIAAACEKGAVAVLIDANSAYADNTSTIPLIRLPDLVDKMGKIAASFYGYPAEALAVIGITGTNGKTSCSQYLAQVFSKANRKTGVIGTVGYGFLPDLTPSTHTTPCVIENHGLLAALQKKGAEYVAMEVSSHAMDQNRLAAIPIHTAIFTNLSRDHLDYHQTMEIYGLAKRKLFERPELQHAIINADDAFGRTLLKYCKKHLPTMAYTADPQYQGAPEETVRATHIQIHPRGLSAHIQSPWGEGLLFSPLLGRFNLMNLLAVYTCICQQGIAHVDALEYLSQLTPVAGRMQCYGNEDQALVVVDYAHTPDALEKALLALREHCTGKIFCVFGCGGNRDRGKRPEMGRIAETHADQVIVTNDNPRHEAPNSIADEILSGFVTPDKAIVLLDRKAAIMHALSLAQKGDVVLVAGKGHEAYQQVGDTKHPFNDAELVKKLLVAEGA
jgi:UDP-N-acetylmuramoyl-L-alanyl-D-glutamate--2,6-diaminopimelate ligase